MINETNQIKEIFSSRLRKLREKQRLKRSVLSELCGLDRNAVAQYENQERSPSIEAVCAIADYFEVSVDYLTGRKNFL